MKEKAFLVDLSENAVGRYASLTCCQKLYCICGNEKSISQRLHADACTSVDTNFFYDGEGPRSIYCEMCERDYPKDGALWLMKPGSPVMYRVDYSYKKVDDDIVLKRTRHYVSYDSVNIDLVFNKVYDHIIFDEKTKKITANIDNKEFKDAKYLLSALDSKNQSNISHKVSSYSSTINSSNLLTLNIFFGYAVHIEYNGLEHIKPFLDAVSSNIVDFQRIKNIPIISNEINFSTIEYKIKGHNLSTGEEFKEYFSQNPDNGLFIVPLDVASYLETALSLLRTYASIISYSNLTTILLTKGFMFYDELLKTKLVSHPDTYKEHNATHPYEIMEVSVNFDKQGSEYVNPKDNKSKKYFKVSSTIYKSLRYPQDLKILYDFLNKTNITKIELEILLTKYNINDVFDVIGILNQHVHFFNNDLTLRHITHILRYKLYVNYPDKRFGEEYIDTVNTLNQIVNSKEKAKAFLIENYQLLPQDERDSYKEYLSIDPKCIFEAESASKLKKLHDELSVIYSVFVDASNALGFLQAVEKYSYLNQQIDSVIFKVIPSTKEMQREHIIMKHCINTYVPRVASKNYIALRLLDTISNEKATLGLIVSPQGELEFNQLKGFDNSRASKFIIDTLLEFCKKNKIKLENSNYFLLDLQSDKSKEKKMKDYLSEEEVLLIRNKKLSEVITTKNSPLSKEQAQAIINNFKQKHN